MRLIAVPLARVRPGAPPVTTFLAQASKSARPVVANGAASLQKGKSADKDGGSTPSGNTAQTPAGAGASEQETKLPLTTRMMNKASDFWIGLGREDQKSPFDWKKRTYNLGERLMDKIEYEEWALKAVDPTFGPSLNPKKLGVKEAESKDAEKASKGVEKVAGEVSSPAAALNVPLLFPPSIIAPTTLLSSLRNLTAARQPHHRQRLIWCVVGMPFTIPFIVVPVVPNLPFFYLVWRAWSHWRAYSSSRYLSELISQGRLVPTPSEELDRVMAIEAPVPATKATESTPPSTTDNGDVKKVDYETLMLLKPHTIKALVKSFGLEHQLSVELTRARQQTIKSIQQGQTKKIEEAAAGHRSDESGV